MFQAVVAFLLEVLKDDREEQAQLQTRLFEITLSNLPPGITEGLFANNILSHFNKPQIAKLCEAKQLYNRVWRLILLFLCVQVSSSCGSSIWHVALFY